MSLNPQLLQLSLFRLQRLSHALRFPLQHLPSFNPAPFLSPNLPRATCRTRRVAGPAQAWTTGAIHIRTQARWITERRIDVAGFGVGEAGVEDRFYGA